MSNGNLGALPEKGGHLISGRVELLLRFVPSPKSLSFFQDLVKQEPLTTSCSARLSFSNRGSVSKLLSEWFLPRRVDSFSNLKPYAVRQLSVWTCTS